MFIITRFSNSGTNHYSGSVEGMTKDFEQAKEMLIKLQILADMRRKKDTEEDTSQSNWTDDFVISHSIDSIKFTVYEASYKDVMKK